MEKQVVGTWKMDVDTSGADAKIKSQAEALKGMLGAMTMTLKEDKTVESSALGQKSTGTWSLEGDKITITVGGQAQTGKVVSSTKIELNQPAGDMQGVKLNLVKS